MIKEALFAIRDLRCAIDQIDDDGGREHADKVFADAAKTQAKLEAALRSDLADNRTGKDSK